MTDIAPFCHMKMAMLPFPFDWVWGVSKFGWVTFA